MENVLRDLVDLLLLPPGGPLWLAFSGLILRRTRWRRAGTVCLVLGLGSLLLLSMPLAQSALLATLDRHPPLDAAAKRWPDADAIVVLGAGVRWGAREWGDDVPGSVAVARMLYAAEIHRRTGRPVLITGYTGDGMRQVMERDFSTPVRWLEDRSFDTWENAAHSAAMLRREGIERIYLVTDFWHMPRAVLAFERATDLEVVPAPMGFLGAPPGERFLDRLRPDPGPLVSANHVGHEWLGLLWYRIR